MARLYPRIKTNIPAEVDLRSTKMNGTITSFGTDGIFLECQLHNGEEWVEDSVLIKYSLPAQRDLEYSGKIVRKSQSGLAINFSNIDANTKNRLWGFVAENLKNLEVCPYCGAVYKVLPDVCKRCDWKLTFDSPGYLQYHERMCLLKKLYSKESGLEENQLRRLINFIDAEILKEEGREPFDEFVGTSDEMLAVFSKIRKVAITDIPVLILGESGTGKELTALAIHERSTRGERMFLAVNCAAIPESLLETELFGHERGAFTGAYSSKKGKFEVADGGTVFLDEIGELSPVLQAKLLRFLEDKIVQRLGSIKGKKVDIRLIAATNCDLEAAIADKRFRADLYYRLNAFPIHLPPIRERGEDNVILAKYFLKRFSSEMGVLKTYSKDALHAIRNYEWPGNVRELINKVRRAILMAGGKSIRPEDLDLPLPPSPSLEKKSSLNEVSDTVELHLIKEALDSTGYNVSKSAKLLDINRATLYYKLKKYSIAFSPKKRIKS